MKHFVAKYAAIALLTSMSAVPIVNAQQQTTVNVVWQEPESYTDIRPTNESRKRFRERIFKDFEAYFTELAEKLPADQTLNITVTNVDLAGHVWPTFGSANDLRIIDSMYIPRFSFSYELKQGEQLVKSAEVDLKELAFIDRGSYLRSSDTLRYEKSMLKRWFNEEFADSVAVTPSN